MSNQILATILIGSLMLSCNNNEENVTQQASVSKEDQKITIMKSYTTQELVSIFLEAEISQSNLDSTIKEFLNYTFNCKLKDLKDGHDQDMLLIEWGKGSHYIYNDPIDTRKFNDETFPDFKIHEGNYLSLTRQVIDNPISEEQEGYARICLTFQFSPKDGVEDSGKWFDLSEDTTDAIRTLTKELTVKYFNDMNLERVTFHIDQV